MFIQMYNLVTFCVPKSDAVNTIPLMQFWYYCRMYRVYPLEGMLNFPWQTEGNIK